ncbi:Glu-tRNA(Gln) amidotransferase subunit GatE [Candidatus Woesearchaeota archaeon]|nr:Glu-tRNA(Gln) amidotransferase subunit GatE [Candidatus Woesearchaeota archaeon]
MQLDYKKLGLKCGLEIHQQIENTKLFCNCPALIRDDEPDFEVQRKLRASVGETGEIDIAALQEMQKGKIYSYQCYNDTTCLVELDEQPPYIINQDSLKTAIQTALLLKAVFVDVIRVMRKIIVDGSNTSGFQRTALIATNGVLKTKSGNVGIPTVILEEDAARIISESKESTVFRLDRLGISLIEISTTPDIITPEQAREVAETIGLLLRSTGKAKRGLGTIRQDVNVSIKEGTRIEIKGAQDLKLIPTIVEFEVQRQQNLVEIKNYLHKTGIRHIKENAEDLTKIFDKSDSKVIKSVLEKKGVVLGICLPLFAGILGKEVQPNRRFGTELSDRAKVIAGVGGLFHSDELPKYGISSEDVELIKKQLNCGAKDAFVIVADEKSRSEKAIIAVIERTNEALKGVPSEVRKANPDGTTSYLRPMPGAARMYPETDIPDTELTDDFTKKIKVPELLTEKAARYEKEFNLSKDLAEKISRSEYVFLFEELIKENKNVKQAFIAEMLVSFAPELARNYPGSDIDLITEDYFKEIFKALNNSEITKESVLQIIVDTAQGKAFDLSRYKMLSDEEIKATLKKIIEENKDKPFNALIGIAMKSLRGKAQGQKIIELLKKFIS